jgi:hypothetical protein
MARLSQTRLVRFDPRLTGEFHVSGLFLTSDI